MSINSLILTAILLVVPLIVSYKQKLNIERDIVYSVIRAIVQLLIVGYLLEYIFNIKNTIATLIIVLIMTVNAAFNTKKRGKGIDNIVLISFISLTVGTVITLGTLVLVHAIENTPKDMIPVGGMIVSNSMIAIGLAYMNLKSGFKENKIQVETKLSLGADIKLASKDIINKSIKLAIAPSIDSAKTLGIVSLPGMMTGLILGGTSPIIAVRFQIMVTFMILASTSLSTIIAIYMSYKNFYNDRLQIKDIE